MIILPSSNAGIISSANSKPGYKVSNGSTITKYSYSKSFHGIKFADFLSNPSNPPMSVQYFINYIKFNNNILLNQSIRFLNQNYTNTSQLIFRNDGYGLGLTNVIDPLNNILKNYISPNNLTFYPSNSTSSDGDSVVCKYKSDQQIIIQLYDVTVWDGGHYYEGETYWTLYINFLNIMVDIIGNYGIDSSPGSLSHGKAWS